MIRLKLGPACLLLVWLAACTPLPPTAAAVAPAPTPTPPPLATLIRFGLVGSLTGANIWALFDARGYSYNDYAVRAGYWPRLYKLSIPGREFEPMAAGGPPSAFQVDGADFSATVPLRSDLTWSDGTPFSAEDVAFSVNTALAFQLGFDWHDYYDPAWLDHAGAVDATTVKFYFKQMPSVGIWQYGALQGPIVQKAFWASRVSAALALLPPPELGGQIEVLKSQVADLQKQYLAMLATPVPPNALQQTQLEISREQNELYQANSDLAKAQSSFDSAMNSARSSLYALNAGGEPGLGVWQADPSQESPLVNIANPKFPFGHPVLERAAYSLYPSESAAVTALMQDQVDAILEPGGLSAQGLGQISTSQPISSSPNHDLRFLVFNPLGSHLMEPAVRQAVACMIDQNELVRQLNSTVAPLDSFVSPGETSWFAGGASLPCTGMDSAARLGHAVGLLQSAGYTWTQVPSQASSGQGLALPDRSRFPALSLLVSSSDAAKMRAASYIQQEAQRLGIPLTALPASSDQINYAVFSSHHYDLALLGWDVSEYPGYLCDWFGAGNAFGYSRVGIQSACQGLNSTSDLGAARQQVLQIQSILAQDLPFVPLYSGMNYDAYRNFLYPFLPLLGGLSGVYGAPSLAVPTSK